MTELRVNIKDTTLSEGQEVLYQGVPLTGEVIRTTKDGTVVTSKWYRDGLEEGPQREWYGDGTRQSEYLVVDTNVSGQSLDWHRNGQLARRQEFDEYGELRKREVWDENGVPQPDEAVDDWTEDDE
jgi:antitoxin component YwqK of YwqJK toxin-antitoxin module